MSPAVAAGLVAGTMSMSFPLLQLAHVRRSGSAEGVSDVAWLLTAMSAATWLAYAVAAHDTWQVVVNTVVLAVAARLLAVMHRAHPLAARHVVAVTTVAAAGALATSSGSAVAATVAVYAATVVVCGHQLLMVLRAPDTTGVSAAPWFANAAASALWAVYGVGTHQTVLEVHAPFSSVVCLGLAVTVVARRRRAAPVGAATT